MSIRASRLRAVVGVGLAVLGAGACTPPTNPTPSTTTTTTTPNGPITSTIAQLSFAVTPQSFQYCVTAGNSTGVISVRLRQVYATPPVSGQVIGVAFDQSSVTPVAVNGTVQSAPFAAGSCHNVTLSRLIPSTFSADFQISH